MEEQGGAAIDYREPDGLDAKIVEAFPGKTVRKDLTAVMKRGANVPTFVLEYLLGMYCSTDDPDMVEQGLARIRKILTENYVRPDESERIKSKIWELRQYTIIDKVSVRFDEYRGIHVATFANLSIDPVVMPEDYVRSYPKMLCGGMWCILRMEYFQLDDELNDELADVFGDPKPARKSKNSGPEDNPYRIGNLTPIQMPNIDLGDIISKRKSFTTEEWMDLLLRSAGYEPDSLDLRTKLHFIERMVPLVERNYNLCELGPRGTGKSHIYNEVSPYAILLSGGQTTTANLFGRLNASAKKSSSLERTGLVGNWDVVAFDEVAGMHFKDMNAIQILEGYMAGGTYARGRESFNGDASMVFEGNINDSVQNVLKTTHLFDPFPPEFNEDSAFFDRIHCYLPGWEVPKMRSDLLTKRYGLITDCLSEFCKGMRKRDYTHHLDDFYRLNGDFNTRDEIGVRKTFSGLMKLLFPDERMSHDDAKMIPRLRHRGAQTRQGAVEDHGRYRIHGCQPRLQRAGQSGRRNDRRRARAKRQQPRARGAAAGGTRLRNRQEHRGQTRRVQTREQSHRGQLPLPKRGHRVERRPRKHRRGLELLREQREQGRCRHASR